ncbi:MAG: hypothetical protein AB1782_11565 [Cyanobacteriota bacterium]
MANSNLNNDPRYNLYYYWGIVCFTTGLLIISIIPSFMNYFFLYPPNTYFTIPGCLLLFIAAWSWAYTPETQPYQAVIIGCGLIFFGMFEMLIKFDFISSFNLALYSFTIITGFLLIFSSYHINLKTIRSCFNLAMLASTALLCSILITIIIYKCIIYG